MLDILPFRSSFPETRRRYRLEVAADAVGECCISLLRQDKTRQAKTGQACLFVSQPCNPPQACATQKRKSTVPTSCPERVARRIERTISKKRGRRVCRRTQREARELRRRKQNKPRGREGTRRHYRDGWGWCGERMKLKETLERQ